MDYLTQGSILEFAVAEIRMRSDYDSSLIETVSEAHKLRGALVRRNSHVYHYIMLTPKSIPGFMLAPLQESNIKYLMRSFEDYLMYSPNADPFKKAYLIFLEPLFGKIALATLGSGEESETQDQ